MKKLSMLFILVGALVISFPYLQEKWDDWQQARVMSRLEQELATPKKTAASPQNLQSGLSKLNSSFTEGAEEANHSGSEASQLLDSTQDAIGLISIDKIDVRLPILEDATVQNMKVAATHLVETSPIGSEGNAAIAAHRAHKKGRLFNRLGELEIGDDIQVTLAGGTTINYKVDRITVVEPTDLSVLEDPKLGQVLTLITCDPLINPTHRLIVRAVAAPSSASHT